MFTAKYILDYSTMVEEMKKAEREKYQFFYEKLNIVNKMRYKKICNEIEKIVSSIKKDSYWDYVSGHFLYKSNFEYNAKLQDITFTINSIKREEDHYVCLNNTDREQAFLKKYQEILKRLAYLETKKEELYNSLVITPNEKVVDFQKKAKQVPSAKEKDYSFYRDYISNMASSLVEENGIDCIKELIYMLNKLDNIDKPNCIFNIYSSSKSEEEYKRNMFLWISTYSNPGEDFLNRYYEKYVYGPARINRPNYSDMMTDNLIKLHL